MESVALNVLSAMMVPVLMANASPVSPKINSRADSGGVPKSIGAETV